MATLEESVKLLIEGLAETNRKFAESHEKAAEKAAEAEAKAAEKAAEAEAKAAEKAAEAEAKAAEKAAEAEAKAAAAHEKAVEENRKGMADLRDSHNKLGGFFNDQWGKLVEALVNNQIVPLLQERGIPVGHTTQRVKGPKVDGGNFEFDIIAVNGDTIVVIEVKTTLGVEDVRDFLEELCHFKEWLPRYSDMKVHGAVAFLHETGKASVFAAKKGLFTMLASGSGALITNPTHFKPKHF